jgi:hypothetical protein
LVEDAVIYREEVIALPSASPTSRSHSPGSRFCWEVTKMKRKLTKAELEDRKQMVRNAERTRALAEKAQAELERRKRPEEASG